MAIIWKDEFTQKYANIELDLRDNNTIKQLRMAGLGGSDIRSLTHKDGRRLARVNGKLKEVFNASRDGKINAEEAYLYFEEKDANGSWASVDSNTLANPNQMELDKRIRILSGVFDSHLDTVNTRPEVSPRPFSRNTPTLKIPMLAELALQQANQFFDENPQVRYDRLLSESEYGLRLSAIRSTLRDETVKKPKDLFSKLVKIGGKWESVNTHISDESDIRLIAYRNQWKSKQRDMLRFIQPGEWYLGTSHHNVGNRKVTRQVMQDAEEGIETLKFNVTHVRNYIGVRDARNKSGIVATDSPRSYASSNGAGHANNKDYPFLLWRVKFLGEVSHAEQRAYINNIRTWSMLFNKVTKFPLDYNGDDNLMTYNMEKVIKFASHVLGALTGSRSDLDKLHSKAEQVYCSESGLHIALNLGLNVPLNKKNMLDNFGDAAWKSVQVMLKQGKSFWKNDKHQDYYGSGSDGYVKYSNQNRQVEMEAAPDWLQPLNRKLSDRKLVGDGLAFRPWNTADMIEYFIQTIIPREGREGWNVSNAQAELLLWVKPSIFRSMGFSESNNPPPRDLVILFDSLIAKVRKSYNSYDDFRKAIQPELAMANKIVTPDSKGSGAFVPPHMAISIKGDADEMIALEPVGQCFHEDLLQRL